FYEHAQPTWKLGIRFLWGSRRRFDYTFAPQLDARWSDLPRPNGFYCDDEFADVNEPSALMRLGKVFHRQEDGSPNIQPLHAFHIEYATFVSMLEKLARDVGVDFMDGQLFGGDRDERGVSAVHLADGRKLEADFFIDAS